MNIKTFLGLNKYVSELDQFLNHYDQSHPTLSASQQKEISKYQRIFNLRDKPTISNTAPGRDEFGIIIFPGGRR
jgi:hypothetical protein